MATREPEFPAGPPERDPADPRYAPNPAAAQREWDECFCCEQGFLAAQLDERGFCTVCGNAATSFQQDSIPCGPPCCRTRLSAILKERQG